MANCPTTTPRSGSTARSRASRRHSARHMSRKARSPRKPARAIRSARSGASSSRISAACPGYQEAARRNDDLVTVGCFPQKQNDGARRATRGASSSTSHERPIGVRPVDLAGVDGLAERLPLAVRMAAVLKRGPRSFAELAADLNAKVDSVIKAGQRLKAFTKVPSADGVTRLALVERHVA